jgi:hypothetical protein
MTTEPTHAFVGYDSTGTAMELIVDDGTKQARKCAAKYFVEGGSVERVTIEEARKVRLYEKKPATTK